MFKIGCDPEIFVGSISGPKSIVGLIGGTKEFPRPLLHLGEGFAVQEDNVALEFNIPASETRQLFVENVCTARDYLERLMHDQHGLSLLKDSALVFPDAELQDPAAQEFGCEPDYNAWTGNKNPRPKADNKNLRSCGGHVHIGVVGTKYEECNPREIIKWMDLLCSVPAVTMDTGSLRKQLYGKAGAYRLKPYGPEYRTMSNFWVVAGGSDNRYIEWVYDQTERALDAVYTKKTLEEDAKLIQHTINNNVAAAAAFLVEKYQLKVL